MLEERVGRQALGQEIGRVICGGHVLHAQHASELKFANLKEASIHVSGAVARLHGLGFPSPLVVRKTTPLEAMSASWAALWLTHPSHVRDMGASMRVRAR